MIKKICKKIFTVRRLIAAGIVLVGFFAAIELGKYFINTNTDPKLSHIEIYGHAFQIVSVIYLMVGSVIAVWQYYLTSRSELQKNNRDNVTKAVELAGYYKDNILKSFLPVRYVYEETGIMDILIKIDPEKMICFDRKELEKLLSVDDIQKLKDQYTQPKFLEAVLEANYIFDLQLQNDNDQLLHFLQQKDLKKDKTEENDTNILKSMDKMIGLAMSKVINSYMAKEVSGLLNNLEYFALYFTHNAADQSVVYQSLHKSYIEIVEALYYNIANSNSNHSEKIYTNVIKLYHLWKNMQYKYSKKENEIQTKAYNDMESCKHHGTILK